MIEMGTLIKSSRKPLCPLYKSIFHRQPAANRRLTGITIKLQRFHGFAPAAIKNTAKSIFQMNWTSSGKILFAVFLIAAGVNPWNLCSFIVILLAVLPVTRSSADADKPARRVYTGYGFLLVFYGNFVRNAPFLRYSPSLIPWPWNLGQRSLKVTIQQSACDFLLTFYSNWLYLVSFLRYSISKNVVTLKSGLKFTQGHWEWYHSIDCVWFPISVL